MEKVKLIKLVCVSILALVGYLSVCTYLCYDVFLKMSNVERFLSAIGLVCPIIGIYGIISLIIGKLPFLDVYVEY